MCATVRASAAVRCSLLNPSQTRTGASKRQALQGGSLPPCTRSTSSVFDCCKRAEGPQSEHALDQHAKVSGTTTPRASALQVVQLLQQARPGPPSAPHGRALMSSRLAPLSQGDPEGTPLSRRPAATANAHMLYQQLPPSGTTYSSVFGAGQHRCHQRVEETLQVVVPPSHCDAP